ncbi:MAG TPA: XRE family transcriptional regulator [Deinococcales bacterium]|nr:XRE family transcriptional regulator [Deinococcales bacterium]
MRERREEMPGLAYRERTQTAQAERMGVSQSFLGRLERGWENLANYDLSWFQKNARHYRWTPEEMLDALGIHYVKASAVSDSATPVPRSSDNVEPVPFVMLPIRDLAQAGQPIDPDAVTTLDRFPLPTDQATPGVQLYRAAGDSMTTNDPDSIRDGDVLIVDTNDREPRDGQVYAVRIIGNGVTVKRIVRLADQWWLFSDNPAHERFQVDAAVILGRVRSWIRIVTPNRH